MLGFTSILTDILQSLRVNEVALSNLFRRLQCIRVNLGKNTTILTPPGSQADLLTGNSTTSLSPLITFTVFVIAANASGQTLDTATAYTTLSLISLLAEPINGLISSIPLINAANASFNRIEQFLKSDARKDHRLPLQPQRIEITLQAGSATDGIELQNIKHLGSVANSSLLVAQNASFAWSEGGVPAVRNLDLALKRYQICFVIGPVGCGKSTLLKGLLGETPSTQGFVYSNSPDTAFIDQTSWIRNGTIQQNILGISPFEEPWYSDVVHACALESDIAVLPRGHGMPPFFKDSHT